jgi:acyl-coenzyme A thioesterase PaaI-like protein
VADDDHHFWKAVRVVHRGASVAFVEGLLKSPDGELLATGSCTTRIIRREA